MPRINDDFDSWNNLSQPEDITDDDEIFSKLIGNIENKKDNTRPPPNKSSSIESLLYGFQGDNTIGHDPIIINDTSMQETIQPALVDPGRQFYAIYIGFEEYEHDRIGTINYGDKLIIDHDTMLELAESGWFTIIPLKNGQPAVTPGITIEDDKPKQDNGPQSTGNSDEIRKKIETDHPNVDPDIVIRAKNIEY